MSSVQPVMAPYVAAGTISGDGIIDDLVRRIVDKLEKSGDLRSVDSFGGYAAKVSIQLQMLDMNETEVKAEISVGTIDPKLPVREIALGTGMVAAEADDGNLERAVDPDGVTEVVQAPQRRQYVSRIRGK